MTREMPLPCWNMPGKSLDDAEKNGAGTAMRFDRHTME